MQVNVFVITKLCTVTAEKKKRKKQYIGYLEIFVIFLKR